MKTFARMQALAISTLAACFWVGAANAVSTDVVLNLEGNPTCSSLGPNAAVLEIKISGPDSSGSDATVSGAAGQEITYSIDSGNAVTWSVSVGEPVNYVILKGKGKQGGGTVYHYGVAPGADTDSGLALFPATSDEGANINALSFCYGLSQGTQPPPEEELPTPVVETLGSCNNLLIDGTKIDFCPTSVPDSSDDERIILSFNLSDDANSQDFNMQICTCNLDDEVSQDPANDNQFTQCDPDATQTAGNPPSGDVGGPCSDGDGFVERVPVQIMGVEDPDSFFCFAAGGGRSCYFHFSK